MNEPGDNRQVSARTQLNCGGRMIDLDRPVIMGILNVTPDSFSDGGRWPEKNKAIDRALRMQEEGAHIIDIGGESTRPGAAPVTLEEELARVIPVIESLATQLTIPVSIDTSKAGVMRAAVEAGAGLINDVCALTGPGALQMAADLAVPVCLMHMQGKPRTMQSNPVYADVVKEVRDYLLARADACVELGISRERILLDPGFGFGKTLAQNIELFQALGQLAEQGYPLLVGVSRKSMIGEITSRSVDNRVVGSVTAAVLAVQHGASIVRVHDVAATTDALKLATALSPP